MTRLVHNLLSGRVLNSDLTLEFLSESFPNFSPNSSSKIIVDTKIKTQISNLFVSSWQKLFNLMKKNSELQEFRFECQDGLNFDLFLKEIKEGIRQNPPVIQWRYLMIFSDNTAEAQASDVVKDSCKFFELVLLKCIEFYNQLFEFQKTDADFQKKVKPPLQLSEATPENLVRFSTDDVLTYIKQGMFPDPSLSGQANLISDYSLVQELVSQDIFARAHPLVPQIPPNHRISIDSASTDLSKYIEIFQENLSCSLLASGSQFTSAWRSSGFCEKNDDHFKLKRYLQIIIKTFVQSPTSKDSKLSKFARKKIGIINERFSGSKGFGELCLSDVPLLINHFEMESYSQTVSAKLDSSLFFLSPPTKEQTSDKKMEAIADSNRKEISEKESALTSKLTFEQKLHKIKYYNKKSKNLLLDSLKLMVLRYVVTDQYKMYFYMVPPEAGADTCPENVPIQDFLENFADELVKFGEHKEGSKEAEAVKALRAGLALLQMELKHVVWIIQHIKD